MKKFDFVGYWRGLTGGQQDALLLKLLADVGGEEKAAEVFAAYLRGEIRVILQDAAVKLVDANGRLIPIKLNGKVVDANRDFYLAQPDLNYGATLSRLRQFFASELEFASAEEFAQKAEVVIASVKGNKQTSNLLKGAHLPLCFPKLAVADYGRSLEDDFLTAVARSYADAFPNRTFTNWRKNDLADKVAVVAGTRHERLVAAMVQGSVVGVYFPIATQGFSIPADREAINGLPGNYLLTGAIDASLAMVAFPRTLARDYNTPGLDCSANSWASGCSLCFRTGDSGLGFVSRGLDANDYYSGGVLVLWQ